MPQRVVRIVHDVGACHKQYHPDPSVEDDGRLLGIPRDERLYPTMDITCPIILLTITIDC